MSFMDAFRKNEEETKKMHSHDRTLLSSLGFADQDKKDPKHTLACMFLCLPDTISKLKNACLKDQWFASYAMFPQQEEAICKGTGQYKATVGFWDVVYNSFKERREEQHQHEPPFLAIEVKIGKADVSDIARQMGLYMTYMPGHVNAVALYWDLTDEEHRVLAAKNIKVIRLGPGFDEFCAKQKQNTSKKSDLTL